MKELIPTINEIIKYGLQPDWMIADKEKWLERDLIKIYSLYFEIEPQFDETQYADFDKSQLPNIRQHIASNFKDFGLYKIVLDINDIENVKENAIGDAVDDLSEIIIDLMEVKWRIENNSLKDGLWYFQFIFQAHTQQHILDLLNYMRRKAE